MASALTDKLSRLVKEIRGQARITEANVQDMLREVRMALLEADVALPVVRDFIARVKDKAMGQEVLGSLSARPGAGGHRQPRTGRDHGRRASATSTSQAQPPAVILMAGLQGAGKTTTTAKLAKHLIEKRKKKVLTVSGDVYRPAAIEQLKTVTKQAGAEWFPSSPDQKPVDIARAALDYAKRQYLRRAAGRHRRPAGDRRSADARDQGAARRAQSGRDAVRGRCHAGPGRGQHRQGLQGSVAADRHHPDQDWTATRAAARRCRCGRSPGAPIKFAGVSEKIDGLEVFDAERHAGRILGMGDIVALVEQVTAGVDMQAAQKLAAKVKSGAGFDLNDFLSQIQQMKSMGGLSSMMDKLPAQMAAKAGQVDMDKAERDIRRKEGIIQSMTPLERRKPELHQGHPQAPHRRRRRRSGPGSQPPAQ